MVPAVNQIEVHPYFTNEEVRAYGAEHGIATEAWSPIAQGGVLDDPAIAEIAERVGKSAAQVTLRWHLAARRHRLPEVVDARSGSRRTSRSSTSSSPTTTWRDQRARPRRGRPHRARTRTRSTTSPTDLRPDGWRGLNRAHAP